MNAPGLRPIGEVATELGVAPDDLSPCGPWFGKVELGAFERTPSRRGRVVLVTALTPTASGEGKTTVSVALSMALRRLGRRAVVCLREPSIGPVFGLKGGGTGGGRAQVVPADEINLHFTGDLHAVSSAHNLLSALIDNALHFGQGRLDPRRVTWPRVLDMNDRALRHLIVGLGGPESGVPREARFDITAASEVMAILCLSESEADLRKRLGRMALGRAHDGSLVFASETGAVDAMTALLRQALKPNLAQTADGGPAIVHGGPFANIAHGCSSLLGTRLGVHLAEDVITEAGFGFDLGGEKFLHLKCRDRDLWPTAVVLVITVRAVAEHGGGAVDDEAAIERGLAHVERQVNNVRTFGLEPILAINVFEGDTEAALGRLEAHGRALGLAALRVTGFSDGAEGGSALATHVAKVLDSATAPPPPRFLYALDAPFIEKVSAIATTLYGAAQVTLSPLARRDLNRFEAAGVGHLPVCMAKTHRSFSSDAAAGGLAKDFELTIDAIRLSAGAGFLVALMGEISTMPGLPRQPAAARVHIGADGRIHGLMQGEQ